MSFLSFLSIKFYLCSIHGIMIIGEIVEDIIKQNMYKNLLAKIAMLFDLKVLMKELDLHFLEMQIELYIHYLIQDILIKHRYSHLMKMI